MFPPGARRHVFMSSFNEYIGGRQAPAYSAKIAFNMGLPRDAQRFSVWVDTYAAEFSRDLEPSVEGGNRTWLVARSCVQMYKAGRTCRDAGAATELCCSRDDKEIWANAWSLARRDGTDYLLTTSLAERTALLASGAWRELCNPVPNPTAFCVDPSEPDGRNGPFMLFNRSAVADYVHGGLLDTAPLFRCTAAAPPHTHFFSTDPACEGGTTESTLGWVARRPGGETLRALYRCSAAGRASELAAVAGPRFHALDLPCDVPDSAAPHVLGYVR